MWERGRENREERVRVLKLSFGVSSRQEIDISGVCGVVQGREIEWTGKETEFWKMDGSRWETILGRKFWKDRF